MSLFNPNISPVIGKWPQGPMILTIGGIPGSNWNPSDKGANIVLSNSNLTATTTVAGAWQTVRAVAGDTTGKRYAEFHLDAVDGSTGGIMIGVGNSTAPVTNYCGSDANGWSWQMTAGTPRTYHNAVNPAYGAACANGDVVGMLFDFSTGTLTFYKNGVTQGSAYTGIPAGTYYAMLSLYESTCTVTARFSSSSWQYAPGVGEVPW